MTPALDGVERRIRAEALWVELGGCLCACQRADGWCADCQHRIDRILVAFTRLTAPDLDVDVEARRRDRRLVIAALLRSVALALEEDPC